MKSKRKYYQEPYLSKLNTRVSGKHEDTSGVWYTFEDTIFYPEGGGQSSDRGLVNGLSVADVKERDGGVWHLVAGALDGDVEMHLDWELRFSNMQQHTGQHILSACFKDMHDLDTVSVHLGREETMIELDSGHISDQVLAETEIRANQLIRENHPVNPVWLHRKDLDKYHLRRDIKSDSDEIRLVQIGELDSVGCGGIHVRTTAEIGLIKISGWEMIRNHVRVKAKIGVSAYTYFAQLHTVLAQIGNQFSAALEDLPERVESCLRETRELSAQNKRVTDLWLSAYAKTLSIPEIDGCFKLAELSKDHLKTISEYWLNINQRPCLFISNMEGKTNFFMRIPENSPIDIQEFMKQGRDQFALKGGGRSDFATGEVDLSKGTNLSEKSLFKAFTDFIQERSN